MVLLVIVTDPRLRVLNCMSANVIESVFFGDDSTICLLQRHRGSGGRNPPNVLVEHFNTVLAGQWCR